MSSGNLPATLKTIESAIELIDAKKIELKKAFDDLQANSSHPSSFSISWSDLDSHFTAIQNSVTQRFRLLEFRESSRHPVVSVPVSEHTRCSTHSSSLKPGDPLASKPLTTLDRVDSITVSDVNRPLNQNVTLNCDQPSSSSSVGLRTDGSVPAATRVDSVVTRPELKEFCERMDWKGLMKYIHGQEERVSIQKELLGALKSAPDPGAMVLDAVEGFYAENDPNEGNKDIDLSDFRRICTYLLEQLMKTGLSFSEEVRKRAKKLALEWKGKNMVSKTKSLELTAFLLLVATYSLGDVVDKEELVEYFFVTSGSRQAPSLSRSIGLGEKVHDLIQKLVDKGKQHHAVKFIFEFGLSEKFPPVPLLDNYLKETKKLVEQVCIDGDYSYRSLNVATGNEIVALKSVIKVIKSCKLDIEYPHECLQMRLEQLEKQLADRKLSETRRQAKKKKKKKVQGEQQQDIESASQQAQGKQQQYIESASQPVQGKQQHEIESASQQAQGKQQQDIESASQPVQGKQQHEIESASQQAQGKQQHDIESASQQAKKKKQAQGKQQQSGNNKRPKTTATVFPTATSFGVDGSISVVPPFQQSHPQPAGLFADQSAAYSSSLTGPFGLAGPTPAVNPYLSQQSHLQPAGLFPDQSAAYSSSLTGPYGLAGPTPAVNPYLTQQSHLQPAGLFLDRSAAYSSSLTGPYGLTGPTPAVNPYLGSSVLYWV